MTDKVQKIREKVERLHKEYRRKEGAFHYRKALRAALFIIDSLQEEPVSEELEEEIDNYVKRNGYDGLDSIEEVKYIANHFVKWQKEQMMKKWLIDD